jgi:putative membrane protein
MAPVMSNQGCYNFFLVAALALGLSYPDPAVAGAFTIFGLTCVIFTGIWGAITVMGRILLVQALPARLALAAFLLASY